VPRSVLFLALGEAEVPAFRVIAKQLEKSDVTTTVATWLPRLAEAEVTSLARRDDRVNTKDILETLRGAGIADPSMAADYDRDWFFGSVGRKRRHVERVFASLAALITEVRPEALVSSVGGETPRIVAEAIASRRGIQRLYFNALPIPRRFVLLPALDSPFVAWQDDGRPLPTVGAVAEEVTPIGHAALEDSRNLVAEGLQRAVQLSRREQVYPPSWASVKVGQTMRRKALGGRSAGGDRLTTAAEETRILYPLHDERDFQVAVRERHALPQEDFLLYVSSVLDPGQRLFVKPHPQHAADHHPILWRRLRQRPNVSFLPADLSAAEAIAGSDVILTLASSLGFEALQVGKPVVCYGTPFYSRRGLTTDVADVRDIAAALSGAVGGGPESTKMDTLVADMEERSWYGQFTPLDLGVENLALLAHGLRDAMGYAAA
jgi:Capsule polysaccharide biosynthesis protein